MTTTGSRKIAVAIPIPAFVAIASLFFLSGAYAKQPTLVEYPPTFKTYDAPYNKTWNAVVKVLVGDMQFYPQAADPQQGFLSTGWKTIKGDAKTPDKRIRIHANVKQTEKGTLVTVRCEINEFVPVKGTKSGKWMQAPSDNTCETNVLGAIGKKLTK